MNKRIDFDAVLKTAGGALVIGVLLLLFTATSPSEKKTEIKTVKIGTTLVAVTVADTDQEREKGLSGVAFLGPLEGKLFLFETSQQPGFWMKDMQFPLDIIWISEERRIVGIEEHIAPESYPAVVTPPENIVYALEVNAGFVAAHQIKIGQLVSFEK